MHVNENRQYYSGYWPNWQYSISCPPLMPIPGHLLLPEGPAASMNLPYLIPYYRVIILGVPLEEHPGAFQIFFFMISDDFVALLF